MLSSEFKVFKLTNLLFSIFLALIASGCVLSQKTNYTDGYYKIDLPLSKNYSDLVLVLQDKRPYVLNDSLSSSYTGMLQAISGISYPLHTLSNRPLAEDLSDLIKKSLEKNSLMIESAVADSNLEIQEIYSRYHKVDKKLMIIVFSDWKTNTFINSTFDYNLNLLVVDDRGKKLFEVARQAQKRIFAPGEGNPTLQEQVENILNGMLNTPEILKAISK